MNWFGKYLSARGWGLNEEVPGMSPVPSMRPFPGHGEYVCWAAVPNQRGWEMTEEYRCEHIDKPILDAARERLGSAYESGFMGELALIDCEYPSLALRGIDYARVAVLQPVANEA